MSNLVKGKTREWEIVIGLEIHAQVSSNSKLFSGSATTFEANPNEQVSFFDAAMPGTLPVLNADCVRQAVRTGVALGCTINRTSVFERKNYFYADLPLGYQISQYAHPIASSGKISIDLEDGRTKQIGIEQLHLEQDAGKSIHDQHPTKSLIDLNRAGKALVEIVSKPDIRSAQEAAAYVAKVRAIMRYIGSCDGDMQKGSLRVDANVSVHRPGTGYGIRCEIKNLNSIRFLKQSIEFEARRQIRKIEGGGEVKQETRQFDLDTGETQSMRSKEDAGDYRYFPEPDLAPLELNHDFIEELTKTLPELPDAKKARFEDAFGLSSYDAGLLTADRDTAAYFERSASIKGSHPKVVANWITSELYSHLSRADKNIIESPVKPEDLGQLVALIQDGTVSGRTAKAIFGEMFDSGRDPVTIIEEKGLRQITDIAAIEAIVDSIITRNPDQVEQYRSGNVRMVGWFVGQVMKASRGKANPKVVNELLKAKLAK